MIMLKKRFIAGAKCPKCQSQDSIIILTTQDNEWIECVECEYSEQRPTEVEPVQTIETDGVGIVQFKTMNVR